MANILFPIALIGVAALVWGGIKIIRQGARKHQGVLMLIAALVLLLNVLIWVVPVKAISG
jgi:hypothetical protein